MINKKFTDTALGEYLKSEYLAEINQDKGNNMFNCSNCSQKFQIKYDDNNVPVSLWCENCRVKEHTIKKQFKMKNSSINPKNAEDPYVSLAQMKVLMDRTKSYWKGKADSNPFNTPASDIILSDIDKILTKAKIPSKYLIAESLD